ncbi:outer membrane protein assembly factor BamE [Sphingomonas sp. ASV193]|uniref:outer membrane protein assembly factor BamE n=1 Tax=Sphingomonas sp. ASV193 TaxID=3144405 RepID=UPI0032E8CFF8
MTVGKLAIGAGLAALLAGCSGINSHRGFVIDPQLAQGIQVGVDNKDSVAKSMGRPTFVGQFNPNDWYYVSQDTREVGATRPRVIKAETLHVQFDQAGNVVRVEKGGKNQLVNVAPMKQQTPTFGRKKSFLSELFSNIGTVGSGLPGGGAGGQ